MNHKLLRIANELNKLILHSDAKVECQFTRRESGIITVFLFHIDDRYEVGASHLYISTNCSDEEVQEVYEQMKRVIAGEALIGEADCNLFNQA
ncbi:hypothetical protein [Staphylococcus argenteus]|uniref:hypothetical protein n=1 Tax=Staphylococcus argenteus TaxID=985002 RepID=UPI001FB90CAA|nr:hypothetical protein [Staphylococcus argenteus]GJF54321.1 hypothetical protein SA19088_10640 [Staphylococcus argenteus]GJF91994.1 hypothetical protein SASC210_00780 [Staphylococcus argenteus]GJF94619.1 hypothetical protein SASC252_00780 [Staphylococcus argenteus]GJF97980.1 hypothetical protein SASC253_07780 [Staphylococcus argenteus]GJG00615.1 hypothetical protein SASC254_07770 [Staphylococcus argenteus]